MTNLESKSSGERRSIDADERQPDRLSGGETFIGSGKTHCVCGCK
jgi:hypothetical protein